MMKRSLFSPGSGVLLPSWEQSIARPSECTPTETRLPSAGNVTWPFRTVLPSVYTWKSNTISNVSVARMKTAMRSLQGKTRTVSMCVSTQATIRSSVTFVGADFSTSLNTKATWTGTEMQDLSFVICAVKAMHTIQIWYGILRIAVWKRISSVICATRPLPVECISPTMLNHFTSMETHGSVHSATRNFTTVPRTTCMWKRIVPHENCTLARCIFWRKFVYELDVWSLKINHRIFLNFVVWLSVAKMNRLHGLSAQKGGKENFNDCSSFSNIFLAF